jgi:type IV pilus biogenesis protein CpaD/CtpE
MIRIVCAVAAASLVGCATTAKFESILDSYIGDPESALISQWGPPDSSYPLGDGSKVLQYRQNGSVVLPGYANATTTYVGHQAFTSVNGMPAMAIAQQCTVNWTVDNNGRVRRWNYNGNACKAK